MRTSLPLSPSNKWHLVQAITLTLGACQSIYLYLHPYCTFCHTDASSMTVMTRFGPDMRRHGLVGRNVGNSREPRRVSWWLPFPACVSPSSLFTSAGGGASSTDRVFCLWHEAMSLFVSETKLYRVSHNEHTNTWKSDYFTANLHNTLNFTTVQTLGVHASVFPNSSWYILTFSSH